MYSGSFRVSLERPSTKPALTLMDMIQYIYILYIYVRKENIQGVWPEAALDSRSLAGSHIDSRLTH